MTIVDGRIAGIEGQPISEGQARVSAEPLILPGFIDLHVHGGGGFDTMEGGNAVAEIARVHARHGTTSMLATTMTAPMTDITQAMAALADACRTHRRGGAHVLGVHLEGPYINPGALGAQPDFARPASVDEVKALHALAPIRLITMAPELPGNLDLIVPLRAAGFRYKIGRTAGTYEGSVTALQRGATGIHAPVQRDEQVPPPRTRHRRRAALAHAEFAEIIPDLLARCGVRTRARSAPRCAPFPACTASPIPRPPPACRTATTTLGSHRVTKCLGGVRLADGTLAGSTLTMDQALRNLVGMGLSLDDASRRVATNAADFLGLADRGRSARVGARAST